MGPPELLLTDSAKDFRPGPSCVDDGRVWFIGDEIGGPAPGGRPPEKDAMVNTKVHLKQEIILEQNEATAWLGCSIPLVLAQTDC